MEVYEMTWKFYGSFGFITEDSVKKFDSVANIDFFRGRPNYYEGSACASLKFYSTNPNKNQLSEIEISKGITAVGGAMMAFELKDGSSGTIEENLLNLMKECRIVEYFLWDEYHHSNSERKEFASKLSELAITKEIKNVEKPFGGKNKFYFEKRKQKRDKMDGLNWKPVDKLIERYEIPFFSNDDDSPCIIDIREIRDYNKDVICFFVNGRSFGEYKTINEARERVWENITRNVLFNQEGLEKKLKKSFDTIYLEIILNSNLKKYKLPESEEIAREGGD